MHSKIVIVCLLAVVSCEPPTYNHQSRFSAPASNYLPPRIDYDLPNNYLPPHTDSFTGFQNSHAHGHGHDNEVPKSYEFGYSVKDAKSGNDYGRREMSDGNVVRGEYRVQLPDGRTQIVTYHADWQTGFHADVRYEGEARYPEPSINQGYNYNVPDYSGSLTGFNSNLGIKPTYGPPRY